MGSVMTHRAGLLCGFFRAGNDVLFFDRLNPKTRRQIRQVGDNGNERPARINMRPTLANLTIKMRDHGNKKVRAAEGPPVLQKNVVLLLDADAGQLPEHVEAVGDILELYQTDPPIPGLLGNDGLERNRRVAMPSSRVVVDDKDFLHFRDSATPEVGLLKSTLDAMWRTV